MLNPPYWHSACLHKLLSSLTRTNRLNDYRITGYLFDCWKDHSCAVHVEHFIACALKEALISWAITDDQHCWHNSWDPVGRKVCQTKASVGKHTLQLRITAGKAGRPSRENKTWRTKKVLHLKQADHACLLCWQLEGMHKKHLHSFNCKDLNLAVVCSLRYTWR